MQEVFGAVILGLGGGFVGSSLVGIVYANERWQTMVYLQMMAAGLLAICMGALFHSYP
jgi:hypothetical protein